MGAGTREADRLARQQEESMERKQAQMLKECPLRDFVVVRDDVVGLHLIKQCPNRRTQDTTLQQKTISDLMDERDALINGLKQIKAKLWGNYPDVQGAMDIASEATK